MTDRQAEGRRLQKVMGAVEPCALVTLDRPGAAPAGHAALVCDVALERPGALATVQAVLSRPSPVHQPPRSAPVAPPR